MTSRRPIAFADEDDDPVAARPSPSRLVITRLGERRRHGVEDAAAHPRRHAPCTRAGSRGDHRRHSPARRDLEDARARERAAAAARSAGSVSGSPAKNAPRSKIPRARLARRSPARLSGGISNASRPRERGRATHPLLAASSPSSWTSGGRMGRDGRRRRASDRRASLLAAPRMRKDPRRRALVVSRAVEGRGEKGRRRAARDVERFLFRLVARRSIRRGAVAETARGRVSSEGDRRFEGGKIDARGVRAPRSRPLRVSAWPVADDRRDAAANAARAAGSSRDRRAVPSAGCASHAGRSRTVCPRAAPTQL